MWKHRLGTCALLATLLLLAGSASAQAQRPGLDRLAGSTPERRAEIQTEFMKSKLALSAEQLPKIEAINLKYAQQMQPVIESSERPIEKMGETRRIQQAKDTELQQVLSSDQYAKYQAAKDEMRERLEQRMREKHQGGGR